MTKFVLNRADAPWDYPSLGFRADTSTAILDGSTFDPPITTPPDVFWTVYGGGSAETGITRYTFPVVPSSTPAEPNAGSFLTWDVDQNRYVPTSADDFYAVSGKARSTDATYGLPAPTGVGLEFVITATGLDDIQFDGVSL